MSRLEKFFETFESKSTIAAYRWGLRRFFESVYGKGAELEASAERYFSEKRNYEEDIKAFFANIKEDPPKTVGLCLAAVRVFLVENGVELPQLFWKRLRGRKKGTRALTLDKVPSNTELRRVLAHMDVKGRALYLALASSGMRIGEALKLKTGDVELDKDPAQINIRGEYTKTGNPRIAYISSEAKEAIEEWLKTREQYIVSASGKSHKYGKPTVDDRLFPFENNTAYMVWRNALAKSQFKQRDDSTNRFTIHPHVLRKFFRTRMATLIPVDVVEALMGHEGYLTEVYRRYSLEDLAKYYKQGEPSLLVFTEADQIQELRLEIEERNRQLQTLVNGLTAENMELKVEVEELRKALNELAEKVETRIKTDVMPLFMQLKEEWEEDKKVVAKAKWLMDELEKRGVGVEALLSQ